MIFITEFELVQPVTKSLVDAHKAGHQEVLGIRILETFGWQEKRNGNKSGYSLEIEAFPADKWVEFKQKLLTYTDLYPHEIETLTNLIKELESFGNTATEK